MMRTGTVRDAWLALFFNTTPPTEICTLSLHAALPITTARTVEPIRATSSGRPTTSAPCPSAQARIIEAASAESRRSEEHTSELQSRQYLVCRLLLEKKTTPMQVCCLTGTFRPTPGCTA